MQKSRSTMQGSRYVRTLSFVLLFAVHGLLFTVIAGCGAQQGGVKPSRGYFDILSEMTKDKRVIAGLENRLFIHATYKSWPLREAYIEEYAKRYGMDEEQKAKLTEEEKSLAEQFNEFFIATYTPVRKWNDFDQSLSIWKIYLEDEKGNRLSPVEIRRVDVESPLVREFYPYVDLWSLGYMVRFPKYTATGEEPVLREDGGRFKLIVAGLLGSTEMEWTLQP